MPLPDLYFVRVDLDEVRSLAGQWSGRPGPADNDDAVEWLSSNGFRLTRNGWHAGPAALDLLHPMAIRYCEPVRSG